MPEGRGSYQHLLKLAEKKPDIKAALNNVDNMTYEEIDALTQFQPWIRKRLKGAKVINDNQVSGVKANDLAGIMIAKSKPVEQAIYDVYQYKGGLCRDAECSIIGNSLTTELMHGDWLLKISPTSLKVNSTVIQLTSMKLDEILQHSTFFKKTDITSYNRDILQPYLEQKYGNDVTIMGTPVNPFAPGNFIQR